MFSSVDVWFSWYLMNTAIDNIIHLKLTWHSVVQDETRSEIRHQLHRPGRSARCRLDFISIGLVGRRCVCVCRRRDVGDTCSSSGSLIVLTADTVYLYCLFGIPLRSACSSICTQSHSRRHWTECMPAARRSTSLFWFQVYSTTRWCFSFTCSLNSFWIDLIKINSVYAGLSEFVPC